MATAAQLRTRTIKDLAALAKRKRIPNWHAMRKEELVKALVNHAKAARRAKSNGKAKHVNGVGGDRRAAPNGAAKPRKPAHSNGVAAASHRNGKARTRYIQKRLKKIRAQLTISKDLALKSNQQGNRRAKDRLVVMVRDPYWLHVYWELSRTSIERAKAALNQHWHVARPVLRLSEVSRNGTTDSARKHVRDIEIHGGVNNWYVDVHDPPRGFQLEIGYLAPPDKFLALAKSNVVSTPQPGSGESFDHNWSEVAKDFDRIFAMSGGYVDHEGSRELKEVFEERLHRPMGDPMAACFGLTDAGRDREFNFKVDTELIVHGSTDPDARVTLRGEPIHLRPDGTFAVRFNLPDRRHVLPVVARSGDGVEQRTIVLAVDRNTKVMEPVIRDPGA
jgi:hypothetical protein